MKTFSPAEQLLHCRAYLHNWSRVLPDQVAGDLSLWTDPECRTIHCAGGWLPYFPEFRALGVRALPDGVPHMDDAGRGDDVGYHLFGAYGLFTERDSEVDLVTENDHDCVTRRFEKQIEALQGLLVSVPVC